MELINAKNKEKVKNFYLIYFEDAVSLNNCVVFRGTYSEARSYAFYYKRAWQKTEKIEKIERAKNFNTGEFLTSDKYTLEDIAAMLKNASMDENGKSVLSEDFIFPSQVKTSETVAEQQQEPEKTPVEEVKPERVKKSVFIEDALKDRDAWCNFRDETLNRLREYLKQKGIEKAPAGRAAFPACSWLADNATKLEDVFEHLLHLSIQGLKNVRSAFYTKKVLYPDKTKLDNVCSLTWQVWFAFCAIDAGKEKELQKQGLNYNLASSILKCRIEARNRKIKDKQEAEELETYWEKASLLKSEIEKCTSREEIKKLLANADGKMCRYALVNLLPYRWKTEKTNEELIEEYFYKYFPISEPSKEQKPGPEIKPVEPVAHFGQAEQLTLSGLNDTELEGEQLFLFSGSHGNISVKRKRSNNKRRGIKKDSQQQLIFNFSPQLTIDFNSAA